MPSTPISHLIAGRRPGMSPRVILFVACLAGCSSFEGTRVQASGELPNNGTEGIILNITRPIFEIKITPKPADKTQADYTLTRTYVADPNQRFAVRVDPGWFATGNVGFGLGSEGQQTTAKAEISEQITPLITSIGTAVGAGFAITEGALDSSDLFDRLIGFINNGDASNCGKPTTDLLVTRLQRHSQSTGWHPSPPNIPSNLPLVEIPSIQPSANNVSSQIAVPNNKDRQSALFVFHAHNEMEEKCLRNIVGFIDPNDNLSKDIIDFLEVRFGLSADERRAFQVVETQLEIDLQQRQRSVAIGLGHAEIDFATRILNLRRYAASLVGELETFDRIVLVELELEELLEIGPVSDRVPLPEQIDALHAEADRLQKQLGAAVATTVANLPTRRRVPVVSEQILSEDRGQLSVIWCKPGISTPPTADDLSNPTDYVLVLGAVGGPHCDPPKS